MCLLWSTNWVCISQKTTFFIVTAVKTSNLTIQNVITDWIWTNFCLYRCIHPCPWILSLGIWEISCVIRNLCKVTDCVCKLPSLPKLYHWQEMVFTSYMFPPSRMDRSRKVNKERTESIHLFVTQHLCNASVHQVPQLLKHFQVNHC
jgi:hypothetical protein